MFRNLLLIGLGGAVGSVLRYLTALGSAKFGAETFPFGTFFANVVGCFVIGVCYALAQRYGWFTPEWRLLLITGFCGGYTTFSTFANENVQLLQNHQYGTFLFYTLGSLALGMAAVVAGFWVVDKY
jgi:fluoride exporter